MRRASTTIDDATLQRRQQWTVLALVVLSTAAMLPNGNDVAMLAKFAALLVAAAALLALGVARWWAGRTRDWPRHPVVLAAAGLALVALAASAWSPQPVAALVGAYGRYAGGLGYAAAMVVLVSVIWAFRGRQVERLAVAVLVGSAISAVYGLLQVAGIDPLAWDDPDFLGRTLSTFGNPNFAAGMLGVGLPVAAWGALHRRWPGWARAASGVVAVASVAAIWGTGELQGWFAGAAGLGVVLLAWVLERPADVRRWALPTTLGVAGLGSLVLVLDVVGVGPVRFVSEQSTFASRVLLWRTGVRAVGEAPVLGIGLDAYGEHYHALRPLEETLRRPLTAGSDAAHNAALNLFAGGGVLMGLAFVALLVVVGWALVVGLRETSGHERLLLGGVGGAWAGYVVQSLVSVEIPPLLVLHAVLAGAVALVGLPPERVALTTGGAARAAVSVLSGVVALTMTGVAVQAVRADVALRTGQRAAAQDDLGGAEVAFERAVAAAPWEDEVALLAGVSLLSNGGEPQLDAARQDLERTLERNPRSLSATITLARVALRDGDVDRALALYERAQELAPNSPDLGAELALTLDGLDRDDEAAAVREDVASYGRAGLDAGLSEVTVQAMRRAIGVDEELVAARLVLAEALLAEGDPARAAAQVELLREQAPELEGLDEVAAQLG